MFITTYLIGVHYIVDTLEFFPHNSPMPQLLSTDRLIMATNYMSNALKHPHPEVPFAHTGDDTITALAQMADIFKNNFQKTKVARTYSFPYQGRQQQNTCPFNTAPLPSTMPHKYQTSSQRKVFTTTTSNTPLLPRVVTPMTGWAASPRMPA
jgi:hypothetical protein